MQSNLDHLRINLSILPIKIDVICLTECWTSAIDGNYIQDLAIPGYNLILSETRHNKNGGVALFVKDKFTIQIDKTHFPILECDYIAANIITGQDLENVHIFAVYRNPLRCKDDFIDSFTNSLSAMSANKMKVIICGDLNIDVDADNKTSNRLLTECAQAGFTQLVGSKTRVSTNSSSCIDLIFVNFLPKYGFETITLLTTVTDHFSTILQIPYSKSDKHAIHKNSTYKIVNYLKISERLALNDWTQHMECTDSNTCVTLLENTIVRLMEQETTIVTGTNHYHKIIQPWVTKALIARIRKRDRIAYLSRKKPLDPILKYRHRLLQITLRKDLATAKCDYFKNEFNLNRKDGRKNWALLKTAMGFSKPSNNIQAGWIRRKDGSLSKDHGESANILNNHFVHAATTHTINQEKAISRVPFNSSTAFFSPATSQEVNSVIKNMKSTSSLGPDNIPIRVYKENANILSPILAHAFNLSLQTGIFPTVYKEVKVVPVFKKGDNSDPKNFRPISVLKAAAKIFDKMLHSRLFNFVSTFSSLLSDNQHGFRPDRSTSTVLNKLVAKVRNALHEQSSYAFATIDLSKAFDSVHHRLLIDKMERMGIRGTIKGLFESYLINRPQRVLYNGHLSDMLYGINGVPQGSSLGPLLYLIFSNDLCELKIDADLYAFADDTGAGRELQNISNDIQILQRSIDKLVSWVEENGLSINQEKSEFIVFTSHLSNDYSFTRELTLLISGKYIYPKSEIRYLGLLLDDSLSWKPHIHYTMCSLRKFVPITIRLSKFLPYTLMRTYYFAYIESKIAYGIELWGSTHKTKLLHLQRLQNIIVRNICRTDRTSSSSYSYQRLHALTCYTLNIRAIYTSQWKQIYITDDRESAPLLLADSRNGHVTRSVTNWNYRVPKYYTDHGRFDLTTRLPILLNFLIPLAEQLHDDWTDERNVPNKKLLVDTLLRIPMQDLLHLF